MATKKKTSRPTVPTINLTAPTPMAAPQYKPMSLADYQNWLNTGIQAQLATAPMVTEAQRHAQEVLFRNMASLQREQAPQFAATANQLLMGYDPQFYQQYVQQQRDINTLGANVRGELAAGYELGPALGREVEQAIRGAQTARGNILGAAPTAQEAFGKGQAAINLYQQRLGNYNQFLGQQQNYLQGKNMIDMMGQVSGQFMGQNYYPSQSYVDSGLGAQGFASAGAQAQDYNRTVQAGYSSFQSALQDYNANQITSQFGTYDRRAESWMYDEAVRRGLYSTPSLGGGGGMGGMMGGIGGALGGVGSAAMGLAASGAIGTGATAAGVGIAGAVAGAGAAICWLARRCIPNRWEEFQHWLFTDAPEKLRRLYIYNARRLAREISDDEAIEIGELMDDCINLRSQS